MSDITVRFEYHTGITEEMFRNVRLKGSWSPDGRYSDIWSIVPMNPAAASNGCQTFVAAVHLSGDEVGKTFSWGVLVDADGRPDLWGIMTEGGPWETPTRYRTFVLGPDLPPQDYYLLPGRYLGANICYREQGAGISFTVWAPHARKVETVRAADDSGGYIWNDGRGVAAAVAMSRDDRGVWRTDPNDPALADYTQWLGKSYMFRVEREDGSVSYRSDLYSRRQAGFGSKNPEKGDWNGQWADLDPSKSCSVVLDPDRIYDPDNPDGHGQTWVSADEFWNDEFDPLRRPPGRIEDMCIYEMHIAGLGAGRPDPGNLDDAIGMLDYLVDLGINAIELLPVSCFEGLAGWGYGTSHFYANKYDHDGQDRFRHFVRACHRRGLAVIVDVVYNHYTQDSERCQWMYDTTNHDHNSYYYYHGSPADYPDFPEGGYCDNLSTGYLPNMAEEMVRKMLTGSAATMAIEAHVDGFRMDLTQALHSFNVLHKDGSPVPEANEAGIRFMREWTRTLRFFRPDLILIAEDHSGWNRLNRGEDSFGIGFDVAWWSEWYHQLIGDSSQDASKARLLLNAGYGTDRPLGMTMFAGMVLGSPGQVVYHESHDEAGNSEHSARNIQVAVNGMLFDNTRAWAEARCRVVAGLTLLSAGAPMFFMGEEVCASKPYSHDDFLANREDFPALRASSGEAMFLFYQDLIRLRLATPALRSPMVEILKSHDQDRVLAYRRWLGNEEYVIIASLSDASFVEPGYGITHDSLQGKIWKERLNSDDPAYGGGGVLNGDDLDSTGGTLTLNLPARAIVVLVRKN